MIVSGISLVLEGGGMRGMFSAGVFEAFMQKELIFPHIVGVSAGACNIVSYSHSSRCVPDVSFKIMLVINVTAA